MRILFVWTGVTSYMADCWRELAKMPGVELKVIVEDVDSGREFDRRQVLSGLDGDIDGWRPDVLFAVGWHSRVVRGFVSRADWAGTPKVCCFDMPWRWSLRCIVARWVLRPFLRRYAAAYVPGRICARYAKWLGFGIVRTGLFSIDMSRFRSVRADAARRGFLYVGRMSSEKRVDIIKAAHGRYRELGGTWPLDCYGQGGKFVQPDEMPRIYMEHACLVLASAFDPWPLVALEAMAAGCEVIMSDRCGNRFELTGARVVCFGDVDGLAREMLAVERARENAAAECTEHAESLGRYDCRKWAARTFAFARELTGEGGLK